MRVLYIRNINRVAQIHAQELARRNHYTRVYEPNLTGSQAPLPVKVLKMPERILDLRHIVGKLSSRYFDLVHIHWASYGVLGLVSHIPFIVECHGTDVRYRLEQPFFRSLLKPIFHHARAVLCITPDLLQVVQSMRPDALFFPGPINTQQFAPVEETRQDASRPWTILLFTRLDPIKGAEIAIEGIIQFSRRHPNIRVQLLDWGAMKEQYKQDYGKRFHFIPPVPPEQIQQLIASADVVVGQLALGAIGLSELQAMSCAKPVISSFLYKDAYPVPPPLYQATTAEEVDKHLESLFQKPEIGIALGRKAREWVIANHSYQILSDRLEALYYSILQGHNGYNTGQGILRR